MNCRWHRCYTFYEVNKHEYGNALPSFRDYTYQVSLKCATEAEPYAKEDLYRSRAIGALTLGDYVWSNTGKPRWFVDNKMLELLDSIQLDTIKFSQLYIPHDAMVFIFENGAMIGNTPIRSALFSYIRSDVSHKILSGMPDLRNTVAVRIDCESHDKSYYTDKMISSIANENCDVAGVGFSGDLDCNELNFTQRVLKLIAAAFMYYNARPEWVVKHDLPRSERYNHSQPRDNIYMMLRPSAKYIREATGQAGDSGIEVRPHWRGWVLRTLRHERYARKPDGTCRVILVPPCAIHAEKMADASEGK